MSVPVYFIDARSTAAGASTVAKLARLFAQLKHDFPEAVQAADLCAIKLHFGEMGNDGYISPVHARTAADFVRQCQGHPFFTDTNTLYKGSRSNAVDHLATASAHGFVPETCGAPVLIACGLKSNDWRPVDLPAACRHFRQAKIAGGILDADSMIVLSHFKGHEMAGFGGAIKNLAMGCAPFSGKREQHCVTFQVRDKKCIACGLCVQHCPAAAISLSEKAYAVIDGGRCIGCGECLAHCRPHAIAMNWEVGIAEFTEKMVEYALAALNGKAGRTLYISVVRAVVPLCDCVPWSDVPLVPDIGFLASTDPVAIDQAAFDLVKAAPVWPGSALDGKAAAGDDKFTKLHPQTKPEIQLEYGQAIGLGSRDYRLVKL
ncbi:MAG: hypothetical protein A2087_08805 [Spirochaetes bacterium GWD1_61_31]|nr:MAG: hypothetical protein A2Y37_14490 [Spirochaetes bacterium GWB1_60_80]OHD32385.1 MAG: hypothetical protein A2004_06440 [Spirochaetes bacterium GWC1_61_12]OHD38067.1 MAG: hypothetical protein A2087_08805 [Spirochaetes bacterium GWD1_61_31]OHD44553.1 MAG: hypothetical protein A2Y35_05330 [Spirochaetes bacterium GWE1_60_18]OHD58659.1 MAG: hypothetical protein A2Y32_03285 [Spirochaetes bacterium GWF1_60_12]HAP43210.1 4Fe-4S ferredoxin [Spirochaetaceae bacterium]